MFDKFCDYMYYLLTSPFKQIKKKLNQWYILFRVLGKRFDEAMDQLYDAREQTMLATCDPVMLPVHAEDRKMTQYPGEDAENFRARIANYPEVLRLGGSDPGVLLAVWTLGYESPEMIKANDFKGRVYFETDGSWNLDGSRVLEAGELPDRWAEFYIVIRMGVDDSHPISTAILKKEVRKTKYVGAKDNYSFQYSLSVHEPHSTGSRADFRWKLFFWNYRKADGSWLTDGSIMLDSDRAVHRIKDVYRSSVTHVEEIRQARMHRQHNLFYLDGSWMTEGSRILDAWEQEIIIGYDLHYLDGTWLQDGSIILDGIENQEVM